MFQQSVFRKFINGVDQAAVDAAWERFQCKFLDPEKQRNIRDSIEIQYQEGFCRDLFCFVLGYTINPEPGFNLKTEVKNQVMTSKFDNRSADAAVILNGNTRVIIELKGCDTQDLSKAEAQAFGYKAHHPGCRYVVICNYERLRFYIDDAVEFLEFNLFKLKKDDFTKLYLCLALTQIENDIPARIKGDSLISENEITEKFYKDYSTFKRNLFNNIVLNNATKFDKLLLFRKTQKLLDRLLFIFFCEDRGLLTTNTIASIIRRWMTLKGIDAYQPLYNLFKRHFSYIDTGHQDNEIKVFAYNGGLFKTDDVLDVLEIDDDILLGTQKLSDYDFESDVSVDILGHIFEHSLLEIEEMQNEIVAEQTPSGTQNNSQSKKKPSKRNKDGVFYTPAYITKFIVENTIGRLCEEKKKELGIDDDTYARRNLRNTKKEQATKKHLAEKLDEYRSWLIGLKICDPACGSGAFLNAALHFLQSEHHLIDTYKAHIYGDSLVLSDIDTTILENNLYGVDINEESVEIAKLSLWLHTARRGRKLTTLNGNIKCGNSLIDDRTIAGDKAFDWHTEFPEIFKNGGFDVVIGNPPYVQLQTMGEMSNKYAQCGYESFHKGGDLYCLFTERGFGLLKPNGLQSFIMQNKWMIVDYGKPLRQFLAKTSLQILINFGDIQIFRDAATCVCIFVTRKSHIKNDVIALSINQKTYHGDFENEVVQALHPVAAESFGEHEWSIQPPIYTHILKKMEERSRLLRELQVDIYRGILTGCNDAFYIDEQTRLRLIAEDRHSADLIQPLLRGRDIRAWYSSHELYMINAHNGIKDRNIDSIKIDDYPALRRHLDLYIEKLSIRGDKGDTPYNLRNCSYLDEFAKPKIIYPNMTSTFSFSYDESGCYSNDKTFILTTKEDSRVLKCLLTIFNSQLCKLWIWYNCPELIGGTREIRKVYFENFPVPSCVLDSLSGSDCYGIVALADDQIRATGQLQKSISKFLNRVQSTLGVAKMSIKMRAFYQHDFRSFLGELKKLKIELSLIDQDEWETYFDIYKCQCTKLLQEVKDNERKIDAIVCDLYGLTEEERVAIADYSQWCGLGDIKAQP